MFTAYHTSAVPMTQCGDLYPVSRLAVVEYEALQDSLNLEHSLRTEAERFAAAVSRFIISVLSHGKLVCVL